MDIETKGLGAGSYPEPLEENKQSHKVEIHLSFEFDSEFPKDWDKERMYDDVKTYLDEYISLNEFKNIDITIW